MLHVCVCVCVCVCWCGACLCLCVRGCFVLRNGVLFIHALMSGLQLVYQHKHYILYLKSTPIYFFLSGGCYPLETAKRLQLSPTILNHAYELLGDENKQFLSINERLETERERLITLQRDVQIQVNENKQIQLEWAEKQKQFDYEI